MSVMGPNLGARDDELWNDPDYAGETGDALRAWWESADEPDDERGVAGRPSAL